MREPGFDGHLAAVVVSFKDLYIYSWSLLVQESKNTTKPCIKMFGVGRGVGEQKQEFSSVSTMSPRPQDFGALWGGPSGLFSRSALGLDSISQSPLVP